MSRYSHWRVYVDRSARFLPKDGRKGPAWIGTFHLGQLNSAAQMAAGLTPKGWIEYHE